MPTWEETYDFLLKWDAVPLRLQNDPAALRDLRQKWIDRGWPAEGAWTAGQMACRSCKNRWVAVGQTEGNWESTECPRCKRRTGELQDAE